MRVEGASAPLGRAWLGALLPPLAWILDLLVSLVLTRTVVATERRWPLFVMTFVALGVALAGVSLSRRVLRARRRAKDAEPPADLTLARWGLALGAFFLLLIAATAVPKIVFHPRDLP